MAEKPNINLAIGGHVDHGKSTLVGHLAYLTGKVPEQEVRKYREEAERLGKPTFEWAYVMDRLREERERGLTIQATLMEWETQKYRVTIIDLPGHRNFVKNMIMGAVQADAAIVVVSAKEGMQDQTKEHLKLFRMLGINQYIVAINKMDTVNWDRVRFEDVKKQVLDYMKALGIDVSKVPVIPISAYHGDNLVEKSNNMPWYNGPTLVKAIDETFQPPDPSAAASKPLRIPIGEVYTITGHGLVPTGTVAYGVLKAGDRVIVMPTGAVGEVKSIEKFHRQIPEAKPGDAIGFNLKGVEKKAIYRGCVVGHPDNPPTVAKKIVAKIIVTDRPTPIGVGYTPVWHLNTQKFPGTIVAIREKVDKATGQTRPAKEGEMINNGEVAVVEIVPKKKVVAEKFSEFPALGRLIMRDSNKTVGGGIIIDVEPEK